MAAVKDVGSAGEGSAGEGQQRGSSWERTPWWHWRKVILRQAWRRYAPEQWRHADANYLIYQTAKQRARESLSQRCDPDRIISSQAGYEAAKLKFGRARHGISHYRGSQQ